MLRTLTIHLPEEDAQLLLNLAEEDGMTLEKFLCSVAHQLHRRRHRSLDDEKPCHRENCFVKHQVSVASTGAILDLHR